MAMSTAWSPARRGTVRGFRDPWPSPQSAWNDPPWILEGRVATAWFSVERSRLAGFLSPDIMPRGDGESVRARIRFYDVRFRDDRGRPNPSGGRFREAVVAFASSAEAVDGEVSLFMWTDDDTYMLWGREVFGWPLEQAAMTFEGPLWSDGAMGEFGGAGSARCAEGELGLRIEQAWPAPALAGQAAVWITPRRVLWRARSEGDTREVLLVRPEILDCGRRYEARGEAWLNFRDGHPLAGLPVAAPTFEVVDGISLRVGSDVDVIAEPAVGRGQG
jgi:hypothetical protein